MRHSITLKLNGDLREAFVEPNQTLLAVLRDTYHLLGAKEGCGLGECGSCTVLMNGVPVKSCLVLAVEADGSEILTIEGLAEGHELHPLQKAFIDHHAFQCGFCTSAMILTAKALLERNPAPTEEEISKAISGNVCRCTGYKDIVNAIKSVVKE